MTKIDLNHDQNIPPPTKIGWFDLDEKSNNAWTLDPNLVNYADKYIQNFMLNQTLTEGIFNKCLIPTNIKGETFSNLICENLC